MKRTMATARTLAAVMALVLLVLSLVGCGSKIKPVESTEQEMRVVGKCDEYDIYYEELRFVTQTYKNTLEQKYGKGIWDDAQTAEKYRAELESLVLENLKANYAILTGCKNLFIDINSQEIDQYVQEQIEDLVSIRCMYAMVMELSSHHTSVFWVSAITTIAQAACLSMFAAPVLASASLFNTSLSCTTINSQGLTFLPEGESRPALRMASMSCLLRAWSVY